MLDLVQTATKPPQTHIWNNKASSLAMIVVSLSGVPLPPVLRLNLVTACVPVGAVSAVLAGPTEKMMVIV